MIFYLRFATFLASVLTYAIFGYSCFAASDTDISSQSKLCLDAKAKVDAISSCNLNASSGPDRHAGLANVHDTAVALLQAAGQDLSANVKNDLVGEIQNGLRSKFTLVSWLIGDNALYDKESGKALNRTFDDAQRKCGGANESAFQKMTADLSKIDFKKELRASGSSDAQMQTSREAYTKRLIIAWLEIQRIDRSLTSKSGQLDNAMKARRLKILEAYPMIAENPNPEVLRKEAALTYLDVKTGSDQAAHPGIDQILFPVKGKFQQVQATDKPDGNEGLTNAILNKPLPPRMQRAVTNLMKGSLAANVDSIGAFCKLNTCQVLGLSRSRTAKKITSFPAEQRQAAFEATCSCNLSAPGGASLTVQAIAAGGVIAGLALCPVTWGAGCYGATAVLGSINSLSLVKDFVDKTKVERAAQALPGLSQDERDFASLEARDSGIEAAGSVTVDVVSGPAMRGVISRGRDAVGIGSKAKAARDATELSNRAILKRRIENLIVAPKKYAPAFE
jgi:hypothetical protein